MKYYGKFLSSSNVILITLIGLFFTLAQASNIASVWWLGSINSNNPSVTLTHIENVVIYVVLVISYGLFLLGAGLIIPYTSI